MRLVLVQLVRADQRLLGHVDVAEVARDVHVLPHRAADDGDLAADLDGDVDRLLHPVDVRREARDQDAALEPRDDLLERLADEPLRASDARTLGVRRVAEHEVDALRAELGEAADIRAQAVHRRVVELPVAGVQDPAGGRLQDDRDRVGDRVRDADEADPEAADLDGVLLRPGLLQLDRVQEPVLVQPRLGEAERESGAPDLGNLDLAEEVRKRSDVVLVRVREDDGADSLLSIGEVGHVREDQVDAEVLVSRERQPGVDDHDVVVELVDGHVLADLADTAERDDPKRLPSHVVDSTADPCQSPVQGMRGARRSTGICPCSLRWALSRCSRLR